MIDEPGTTGVKRGTWRRMPALLAASIRVVAEAAPREFATTIVLQLFQGACAGLQLVVLRNVLSAVLTGTAQHDYRGALGQLALLAALQTLSGLAGIYTNMQQQLISELVQRYASQPVVELAMTIDLISFDSPEFHDQMLRAQQTATLRPLNVANGVLTMGQAVFTSAGAMAALLIFSPLLLVVVLIGLLPLWMSTSRLSRAVYRFINEMTPNDRKRMYVLSLLTTRPTAKEIRAFNFGPYLWGLYSTLTAQRITRLRHELRHRVVISLFGALGNALAGTASLALLVLLVTSGHIGLAAAGAAAAAAIQLGAQLQAIVFAAGQLYESGLFVEDLQSFLALIPAIKSARPTAPPPGRFARIEVRNVDFTYPAAPPVAPGSEGNGDDGPPTALDFSGPTMPIIVFGSGSGTDGDLQPRRQALRGVSMQIERGEIVALVGENGSGKTTLAKVLCSLYQPDSGAVYWDGIDVATIDAVRLREQITVIFQDFGQYWLTARENIGLGRVERMNDEAAIRAAAKQAGADDFIEAWPEQYEALMGPIFEHGKDLSTGQWQRMALARAFLRDAPLIILDEPTASLDARAESELFDRIRRLFKGRSVLLISHRFSSVRSADRIYVMREGRIVEQGSHDELMSQPGLYAELFDLQASRYLK